MKVIIVGGTGTIGKAVASELSSRHSVIVVGRNSGDFQVDITDRASIESLYKSVGTFDAVIAATGQLRFANLVGFTDQEYDVGIKSKLMGQVNLVLTGLRYIKQGGSFTLTSGVLSDDPVRCGSSASMVNGAIDSFVKSAAIEMPNNVRVNVVSPTVLTESLSKFGPYFHGFESVPAARVAKAYSKSVDGAQSGQVYRVW